VKIFKLVFVDDERPDMKADLEHAPSRGTLFSLEDGSRWRVASVLIKLGKMGDCHIATYYEIEVEAA